MSGIKAAKEKIPAIQWSTALLPILNEGHQLKIPLSGLSMFPLLAGGRDEAVLSTIRGKKLKRGDIVLYVREDGTHVLHRIQDVKKGSYFMLGDAHTWIEGPISKEAILAVAVAVVRKNKTISCKRLDYRFISAIWILVRPLRPLIMRVLRKIHSLIKRKIK